jgi:ATP-dependent RNA helicase RhlE
MPFSPLGLHASVLRGVRELGFARPTPIQDQAIPAAIEGRDVLACSMTGSGKTAAFLLPILQRLIGRPRGTTRALVLTPTRELAGQIKEHFDALAAHTQLKGAAIVGGLAIGPQQHALRSGIDVVIATPGRLLDHLRGQARLPGVEILVLDEADRMLDMGFLPDVRRILRVLPQQRQTLFFSATMPPAIVTLSREMLRNPVSISLERRSTPAPGITHAAYPVPSELKPALLVELLKRGTIRSVIAFTRTKHRANRLAEYLERHGVVAGRIHGNRSQAQRTQALGGFKDGKFPVLVATDIAARGIDVEQLSHVINFDVPGSPEDYVHRVGRTARAEAKGDAFLFVSPQEEASLVQIERAIGHKLPRVRLDGFDYASRPRQALELPIHERRAPRAARHARPAARPFGRRGPKPGRRKSYGSQRPGGNA